MPSKNEKRTLSRAENKTTVRRFQIEKLEERIAPAKGGIPGSPDDSGGGNGGGGPRHQCRRGSCDG